MLEELGLKKLAYDWREEHVPTFEDEFSPCGGTASSSPLWYSGGLTETNRKMFALI